MDTDARLREWLEAARTGEEWATAELHRVVEHVAHQVARGRSGALAGGIEWEDVAQEALLRLIGGTAVHRGKGSVRGYVYVTVKTSLLQALRSRRRRERREATFSAESTLNTVSSPADGDAGRWIDPDTRRLAEEVLASLGSDCRELVERVFFHGVSYARLAEGSGQAESSVRSHLTPCT